jgi:hypothetical protein
MDEVRLRDIDDEADDDTDLVTEMLQVGRIVKGLRDLDSLMFGFEADVNSEADSEITSDELLSAIVEVTVATPVVLRDRVTSCVDVAVATRVPVGAAVSVNDSGIAVPDTV